MAIWDLFRRRKEPQPAVGPTGTHITIGSAERPEIPGADINQILAAYNEVVGAMSRARAMDFLLPYNRRDPDGPSTIEVVCARAGWERGRIEVAFRNTLEMALGVPDPQLEEMRAYTAQIEAERIRQMWPLRKKAWEATNRGARRVLRAVGTPVRRIRALSSWEPLNEW